MEPAIRSKVLPEKTFEAMTSGALRAMQRVLEEGAAKREVLAESAFPAYTHRNPVARRLFWARLGRAADFLAERAPHDRGLDFGCGGGVFLPVLAAHCKEVVAHDIDLSPLDAMSRHVALPHNVRATSSLDDALREGSGIFDVVAALDVLEHVDDLESLLARLASALRPGGILLVSGPTESWLYRLGRKLAGKEFTGHYHERGIAAIRDSMTKLFHIQPIATVWPVLPLFSVFAGFKKEEAVR
jgi:2-polyprenyl-3-methyl-5-hydroxy-6-metoxy-1,4-benzoquinol methylase